METGEALRQRYLALTREELPKAAAAGNWVVRFDHCFMRILLDHLFGDAWPNHIAKRPAYRQLSDEQLTTAIALGESILERGDGYLRALNRDSLRWRGKSVDGRG